MSIIEVKVPQLSESVAEATLLQWKKKVGDAVAVDEILIRILQRGLPGIATTH
jgi:2-oxoglutarate dehydrogenase E2 component (dihydrolipoamide succinyltransferase)